MFLSHNDVSFSLPTPSSLSKSSEKMSSGILTIKFQPISPLALSPSCNVMSIPPPYFIVSSSVGPIGTRVSAFRMGQTLNRYWLNEKVNV